MYGNVNHTESGTLINVFYFNCLAKVGHLHLCAFKVLSSNILIQHSRGLNQPISIKNSFFIFA